MKESPIIWKPDDHEWTARSHVAEFIKRCGVKSLAELRAASVEDIDWFWREAVDDMGLEWIEPFTRVRDSARGFPHTRWFIDGRINVTHNCIDRHVRGGHGNETALFYESDSGNGSDQVTFAELSSMVDRCAAALLGRGIGPGDCVALYAPMQVRTVVAMFASMKIGALFVPIFCGYGVEALRERLRVCDAKVLFACGTLQRRGKAIDTGGLAEAAAGAIPVIRTDTHEWNEFLNGGTRPETPVACASTSAEDPCVILFTSGTTGRPKGTVHTHGGCLAQIGKELRYAFDARPGEPFFWVTDIGWMMG
ncbi:MAG TPA: AMP-binding protein, partial [Verrucomicrobiae bacterium]|nr:AMP-binding protein [Verrucomicrobiae bacterium]